MKKIFARHHLYPAVVMGGLLLLVALALLLSNNGFERFFSPFDQYIGSPNVVLRSADNDDSTGLGSENLTLINSLTDFTQGPYYDNPDISNQLMPLPMSTPVIDNSRYDLFRIQGRIEVTR